MQGDRASILWATLDSGDGSVVVGAPGVASFTVPASRQLFPASATKLPYSFYQYKADLRGLDPGTEYAYRITLGGATLTPGPSIFRTAAAGKTSFLVFGDSGENTPEQRASIPRMGAEPGVSFLMHTGDLAYPQGGFAEIESNYFALNAPLFERLPVFPTPGNHEYMADSAAPYLASHFFPESGVDPADAGRYYSFNWGDAHFASVDSNLMPGPAADRMLAWLDNDLATTRQFWKIVFVHHPPYPTGHHLGDPISATVRDRVNPIAERRGAQLMLSGHEHGYERTAPLQGTTEVAQGLGTSYIITGGGGAELHNVQSGGPTELALSMFNYLRVDVDGATLTVRATGVDGSSIENFILQPGPVIAAGGVVASRDYSRALRPGLPASIFGRNLAVKPSVASDSLLPLQLGGVRVQLGDRDIPLLYVSPGQVNVLIPSDATGGSLLQIVTANGAAQTPVSIASPA